VIETEQVKIICDVSIQTDHVIEHRQPDIVVVEKDNKMALLMDIAVLEETRVAEKEQKKVDKYQKLARELKGLWKVNTNIIQSRQ